MGLLFDVVTKVSKLPRVEMSWLSKESSEQIEEAGGVR